jgi:hypothetical protein
MKPFGIIKCGRGSFYLLSRWLSGGGRADPKLAFVGNLAELAVTVYESATGSGWQLAEAF